MNDLRSMSIGEIVDFVIDYNNRNADKKDKDNSKEEAPVERRKASQADIDAFFGG